MKNRKQQLESNLAAGIMTPWSKGNHHTRAYLGMFLVVIIVVCVLFYPGMLLPAALIIFVSSKAGIGKWLKNKEEG